MVHRRVRARWVGHDRVGDIVTDHGLPAGVPLDVERPERSQRIALAVPLHVGKGPEHDFGPGAVERHEPVAVARQREPRVPRELGTLDGRPGEEQLDALVRDDADVHEVIAVVARRARIGNADQPVHGPLVVERELGTGAAA